MLASGGNDGVQLWDLRTDKPLGTPLTAGRPAAQVAFSPNGRLLASVGNGTRLWNVRTHA